MLDLKSQENARKKDCESPAMLACDAENRGVFLIGDRKSLSIAKNHLKPSQEFSEQVGPSIHNMKGFSRNSPQKVHPNFAENLGRQILGNTFWSAANGGLRDGGLSKSEDI